MRLRRIFFAAPAAAFAGASADTLNRTGQLGDGYADATWGRWYWPAWAVWTITTLLVPELYALFTNVQNTQSYWVWHVLDVRTGLSPTTWTAAHMLLLVAWLGLFGWLTGHFFWRIWT